MDNENDTDIIDLQQERLRRNDAAVLAAYERGEVCLFDLFEYSEDKVGNAPIGSMDDHEVVILTHPDKRKGIAMTRDDAKKLAAALLECAESKDK
jgi:hypothetical protein